MATGPGSRSFSMTCVNKGSCPLALWMQGTARERIYAGRGKGGTDAGQGRPAAAASKASGTDRAVYQAAG